MSKNKILLSIIVPLYNEENTIGYVDGSEIIANGYENCMGELMEVVNRAVEDMQWEQVSYFREQVTEELIKAVWAPARFAIWGAYMET